MMDDFFDILGTPDMDGDGDADLTDYAHYTAAVQDAAGEDEDVFDPDDPDEDDIGDEEDFDLSDDWDREDFGEDFGDDL